MRKSDFDEDEFAKDLIPPTAEEIEQAFKENVRRVITPVKVRLKNKPNHWFKLFNEDWYLTDKGDMFCSINGYDIDANRLSENDWIPHLMGKAWFDANTFLPAYFEACHRAGIDKLSIVIY